MKNRMYWFIYFIFPQYNRLINDMLAVYNSGNICAHEDPLRCNLRLDPDITALMAKSRDWAELEHTWIEWRRRTGQKIRDLYEQLIELSNYAANLNSKLAMIYI